MHQRNRPGFTLPELIVVVAIIAVCTALLMVCVLKAREQANRVYCAANLKQIGIACHAHHFQHGFLPDGGGWAFAPRSKCAAGNPRIAPYQEWGWTYQIMPFLEQANVWADPSDAVAGGAVVKEFFCPSRRKPGKTCLRGCGGLDYAANGGSTYLTLADDGAVCRKGWYPGDAWDQSWVIANYSGNFPEQVVARGAREPNSFTDFPKGTGNCILVGERLIAFNATPNKLWESLGVRSGHHGESTAWAWFPPCNDHKYDGNKFDWSHGLNTAPGGLFGSAHREGMNVLYVDGSVRKIPYTIGPAEFRAHCLR